MNSAVKVIFFDLGDTLVRVPRAWLPGARALLNSLHQNGFRLGIISNTTGLADRQAILDLLPVDFDMNRFDSSIVLFSSEVGMEKPGKEIFEEAIRRAHIAASECLYCSENIVETLVAQHVGMLSIRVQTAPNSDLTSIENALADFASLVN
jgi:putative hydrolase of the HAD superfamily